MEIYLFSILTCFLVSNQKAGTTQSNNPKIHSFRVISSRDATINSITAATTGTTTLTTSVSSESGICDVTPSNDNSKKFSNNTSNNNTTSSSNNNTNSNNQSHQQQHKIQKPILMCFICKLSFGNTKSFTLHANSEHTLNLNDAEKLLLVREYSSAIIQRNNDEKPQISFLEPLDIQNNLSNLSNNNNPSNNSNNQISNNSNNDSCNDMNAELSQQQQQQQQNYNKNESSQQKQLLIPKSLASLTNSSQNLLTTAPSGGLSPSMLRTAGVPNALATAAAANRLAADLKLLSSSADYNNLLETTKSLNDFLQQQQRLSCPEHQDVLSLKDIDCKNCELININHMQSPQPASPVRSSSKSPLSTISPLKNQSFNTNPEQSSQDINLNLSNASSNSSSSTSSPITSNLTPTQSLLHQQQQMQGQQNLNTSPSFTIGACPDHMNGRPIGVDCAR